MLTRMCVRFLGPVALLAAGMAFLAICGCGGGTTNNPTPQITGLIPPEITAGSQPFTLFVSGTQFISTTTVQWNGADLPTTFDSVSGQLLAAVPAADVQTSGVAQVTVTSPSPGGGRSLAVAFTINPAGSNGPTITSLSPSSAPLNSPAFTLTVNGTNFAQSDYVTWNGGIRTPMNFVSATQVTVSIPATDLTVEQVASIAVHTSQLSVASPSVGFQVGNSTSGNVKFPQLVSVAQQGDAANGLSSSPAISADGRYIAFYSQAKNLMVGGESGNIFLRDTCVGQTAGCTPSTVPVDLAANGAPPNAPAGIHVAISADGRYVAFASNATNLTSQALSGPTPRVFVRDMCTGATAPAGCVPRTELVSFDGEGMVVSGARPSISADGRFVAFNADLSKGSSSVATISADGRIFDSIKDLNSSVESPVMVRDTCRGAAVTCSPQTVIASAAANADLDTAPAISYSGRYVAFVSAESRTGLSQAYVVDTCLGADRECLPSTALVSAARDGRIGNGTSGSLAISGDGRFVAFESAASNLADNSTGGEQIYLRDTCIGPTAPLGCTPSTTQVSGSAVLSGDARASYSPSISPSGRYVSYIAHAENEDPALVSSTPGYIVIYDTCFGSTGPCSPHAVELTATDPSGSEMSLIGDIRVPVPVIDAGFASFFTRQAMPAVHASGLGDVFLTTTPFRQ